MARIRDIEGNAHLENIVGAWDRGMVTGRTTTIYAPKEATRRDQSASVLVRLLRVLFQPPSLMGVRLSWENEVDDSDPDNPVFRVGDEPATGWLSIRFDDDPPGFVDFFFRAQDLSSGPLDVEGLGPLHIHQGRLHENGPIVIALEPIGTFEWNPEDGTVILSGYTIIDPAVSDAILDNRSGYYVNYHTEDHPAGAIRGHLPSGGQHRLPSDD